MRTRVRFATIAPPVVTGVASLVIEDPEPLIMAALGPPLAQENRGYSRGQRLYFGYQQLSQLRDDAGRWEGDKAILSMPKSGWERLDRALEPVDLAAEAVREIVDAADADAEIRRDLIQEYERLLPELTSLGARLTSSSMVSLRQLLGKLESSDEHADRVAYPVLYKSVSSMRRSAERDCTASLGECSL